MAICTLALLCGCNTIRWQALSEQKLRTQVSALSGTYWRVNDIEGVEVAYETPATLEFDISARVAGSTGCSVYTSHASVRAGVIRFGDIMTAEAPCPIELLKREQGFFRALNLTRSLRVEDQNLLLLDAHGRVLVRMRRLPDLRWSHSVFTLKVSRA